MPKGDTVKRYRAGKKTVDYLSLHVCVFIFPSWTHVHGSPTISLEHPGPDVVFYQDGVPSQDPGESVEVVVRGWWVDGGWGTESQV